MGNRTSQATVGRRVPHGPLVFVCCVVQLVFWSHFLSWYGFLLFFTAFFKSILRASLSIPSSSQASRRSVATGGANRTFVFQIRRLRISWLFYYSLLLLVHNCKANLNYVKFEAQWRTLLGQATVPSNSGRRLCLRPLRRSAGPRPPSSPGRRIAKVHWTQ